VKAIKICTRLKNLEYDIPKSKLYDEIKDLSIKYNETNDKYELLSLEYKELMNKFENELHAIKKEDNVEDYENLLQEQFETMRISFIAKIEDLETQLNTIKIESRKKNLFLGRRTSRKQKTKRYFP